MFIEQDSDGRMVARVKREEFIEMGRRIFKAQQFGDVLMGLQLAFIQICGEKGLPPVDRVVVELVRE